MKLHSILLPAAFSLSLALIACGGDSKGGGGSGNSESATASVTSDGKCTSEFVHDYNMVTLEAKSARFALTSNYVSEADKEKNLRVLNNACKKFQSSHPGTISCEAIVEYVPQKVSSENLQKACDAADLYFNPPKKEETPVATVKPPGTAHCSPQQIQDFSSALQFISEGLTQMPTQDGLAALAAANQMVQRCNELGKYPATTCLISDDGKGNTQTLEGGSVREVCDKLASIRNEIQTAGGVSLLALEKIKAMLEEK